jgi:hypothetical protein
MTGEEPSMCARVAIVALVGLWQVLPSPATAQDVVIDFEHYPGPDGVLGTGDDVPTPSPPSCSTTPLPLEQLLGQYTPVGVTFTEGTLFCGPVFTPGLHFTSAQPLAGTFSVPVREISVTSNSAWDATLTAYDGDDNVVAAFVLSHPAPGTTFFLGTLRVSTAQPIARFAVRSDHPDHILNLDDLTFGPGQPLDFFTLAPCRLVDTRSSGNAPPLAAGADRVFQAAGVCGVPATARAISIGVVVTEATDIGHVRLAPAVPGPLTDFINYAAGDARSNNGVVALSPTGTFTARCVQASGTAHFIVDVTGYFE